MVRFWFVLNLKKISKAICTKEKLSIFALTKMVVVAQLVRALDCGSRGRRFEPDLPPKKSKP